MPVINWRKMRADQQSISRTQDSAKEPNNNPRREIGNETKERQESWEIAIQIIQPLPDEF